MCYSNFVPKTRHFSYLRLQKMLWPWKPGSEVTYVFESGIIRQIMYGFLLLPCSNFVRKTHLFEIFDFKNAMTLKKVKIPWRSLKISPFDRAHTTSYWRFIGTMALSRVVSEIFNIEKYHDLEILAKDQSRSLKVVPFDRLFMVSC